MAVGNSLAGRPRKMDFAMYLTQDAAKREINRILGGAAGTRFISSLVSAVQANPALRECTNPSLLSAALQGEALKLSPSPQLGQCYMVPYKKKARYSKNGELISPEVTEAQFQIGYKGYVQLAKRSGVYKKINVISIKEGELVSYDPLEEEIKVNLIQDDLARENTPTIGYYAMFEEMNGYRHSMYWSKEKMMAHADKYSAAFHAEDLGRIERGEVPEKDMWKYSSFWYKDFDAMAHKTMLRQLISKWGTMSIDLIKAEEADMAIVRENGAVEHMDMAGAGIGEEDMEEAAEEVSVNDVKEDAVNAAVQETEEASLKSEDVSEDPEAGFFDE